MDYEQEMALAQEIDLKYIWKCPICDYEYEPDDNWPKKITLHFTRTKEANYNEGKTLGLKGQALHLFTFLCEIGIVIEVDKDGSTKPRRITP